MITIRAFRPAPVRCPVFARPLAFQVGPNPETECSLPEVVAWTCFGDSRMGTHDLLEKVDVSSLTCDP